MIGTIFTKIIAGLTQNDIVAGEARAYPNLDPPTYTHDGKELLQQIKEAFKSGGDLWKVEEFDTEDSYMVGTVETPIFGFTDDFQVWLEEGSTEQSWVVRARSKSRVGIGDLGKNAQI